MTDYEYLAASLKDRIAQRLGSENVSSGREDQAFYSMDMYSEGETVDLVVKPKQRLQVGWAVKECTQAGYAVIPRGGGMSYTAGYLSPTSRAVVFDLSRLTKIIEINREDMYVTVECGCTWQALYEALSSQGLRTPFFGPLSGGASTVGGALSQNSIYFGSAMYGTAAESVLGLEVAIADGSTIITGSAADRVNPTPFYRPYGCDLTGLFLADTGALGLKLSATLQLINLPRVSKFASFAYENHQDLVGAISEISRAAIASECFGTDARAASFKLKRETLGQDLSYLWGVVRSGNNWLEGLTGAARLAIFGRRALRNAPYIMHVTIAAESEAIAREQLRRARGIGRMLGKDVEPTFPRALHAKRFSTGNGVMNADGRRYLPIHGICPHSRGRAVAAAVYAFFELRAAEMTAKNVEWGCIIGAVGRSAVVVEPLIYWADEPRLYEGRMVDTKRRARWKQHETSQEAGRLVNELREGLRSIFRQHGCVHLQIGRFYPYRETRQPSTFALLQSIKAVVDPKGLINPGSLGL